jgi:hypothetical protein
VVHIDELCIKDLCNMLGFLFEAAVAYAVIAAVTYTVKRRAIGPTDTMGQVHSTHP